jgi:hypothetical protein
MSILFGIDKSLHGERTRFGLAARRACRLGLVEWKSCGSKPAIGAFRLATA